MRTEEGRGCEAAEAVKASEDFVEDDGEAGPGCFCFCFGGEREWSGFGIEESGGVADCFDEGVLEEGITRRSC